ncbi:MAG: VOC family protein [Dongiaceae bacterium]
MGKLIHAMIRVLDLKRSIEFYDGALGACETHRLEFPDFTLVYLREPESGFEIELTANRSRSEPYPLGEAYGHLAVCVDDLDREHARFRGASYGPGDIKEMRKDGALVARFFFVTDPDGYKIEVLQRQGHYQ